MIMKETNDLNITFNTNLTVEPSAVEDYYIVTFTFTNDNRPIMYMCHKDSITWLIERISGIAKWLKQKSISIHS